MFFKKRKKRKSKKSFLGIFLPKWKIKKEALHGVLMILSGVSIFMIVMSFLGHAGSFGHILDTILVVILGNGKWALPVLLGFLILALTSNEEDSFDSSNVFGLFLFLISFSGLLYFWNIEVGGGLVGLFIAPLFISFVGDTVTAIIFLSGIIISLMLILDASLSVLMGEESIVYRTIIFVLGIIFYPFIRRDNIIEDEDDEDDDEEDFEEKIEEKAEKNPPVVKEYDIEDEDDEIEKKTKKKMGKKSKDGEEFIWSKSNIKISLPFDLLKSKSQKPTSGNIDRNQSVIKQTLLDFGISITMGEVTIGPTVTQYTFKPANGVSVSKIKALSDDLALNLAVHTLRIEAPIPGKPLVGLEVPNQTKVLVSLKEILKSKIFKVRKTNTTVPLGRDVTGSVRTDDLVKMPHILIAGATASGKSVFLHSLIVSLLYQNNPDDLKFIMIDQKQVELSLYNGMPYLIAPVITEHKRAIKALNWCVSEMDRRLKMINEVHCLNIEDYNKKKERDRLPFLVVVVDELGDLLSTAKKEAEGAIIRLGQKARAAGIHLVLATQRPSVDILSGLIKANMPARAAFSVTSSVNSKTILDFVGAEKLLGEGDMLYINSAMSKPIRIQGAYIEKDEIKKVVRYIKEKTGKTDYQEEFDVKEKTEFSFDDDNHEGDVMMEEAMKLISDSGKASAAMLQSRLSIGYPRANRILDNLEKQGMVGPSIQNKPREVFLDE